VEPGQHAQYSDEVIDWTIWGSIPDRTKRFVSLPNWLWDYLALLFNGYSEAAGGNTDHSPLPSAEVKKDLSDSHSLYIP
jgi:hypothetical protein